MKHSFTRNTKYYRGVVYEWNLPTGYTCPFAFECKVKVDRLTGKMDAYKGEYRCYAASAERFPGVRDSRWANYEYVASGYTPILPEGCLAVRIHASGDFFNQDYFDLWLRIASENKKVEFWAYTKSIKYWVKRLGAIPDNLILTASYGGKDDELIDKHNLKNVIVYKSYDEVPSTRPIDTNDDYARMRYQNFALIDNFSKSK